MLWMTGPDQIRSDTFSFYCTSYGVGNETTIYHRSHLLAMGMIDNLPRHREILMFDRITPYHSLLPFSSILTIHYYIIDGVTW